MKFPDQKRSFFLRGGQGKFGSFFFNSAHTHIVTVFLKPHQGNG